MTGFTRICQSPVLVVGVVLLAALQSSPAAGQLVNTLGGFDPAARGLEGAFGVSLDAEGGNTDVLAAHVDGELRHITDAQTLRLIFGYDYERADGRDRSDDTFVHVRHNHRIAGELHSLLFTQWQRNPFQLLQRRVLLGAGARLDALAGKSGHLTVGAAHMIEFEKVERVGATTAHRLSTFIDASWRFGNGIRVAANSFVQPRWSDFGDVRAIASAGLEIPLGGGFAVTGSGTLTYDAAPPDDVEATDWETSTGLKYRF